MQKIKFTSIIAFSLLLLVGGTEFSFSQSCDTSWVEETILPDSARVQAIGITIKDTAYIGLGEDNDGTLRKDFWGYDLKNEVWTQKADFPDSARTTAIAFSINDTGYVGLGDDGVAPDRKDLWGYIPQSNTWIPRADLPASARSWATAFSLNNKGYMGTGFDGSLLSDFWEYNPSTDSFTQKQDFKGSARLSSISFSVKGKGYIGMGISSTDEKDLWEYDPTNDNWTQVADLPGSARYDAMSFVLGDLAYVGGGYNSTNGIELDDFWRYYPAQNKWRQVPAFKGGPREKGIAFSHNKKGYVGLGEDDNGNVRKDIWEFQPTTTVNAGPDTLHLCNAGDTIKLGGNPSAIGVYDSGYTYRWSPATNIIDTTVANPLATPTDTITYVLTVTDSIGCGNKDSITIITPLGVNHKATVDSTPPCNGMSTGAAHISIFNGQAPFDYYWTGLDTTLNTTDTTNSIQGLAAGTYPVKIVDDHGCTTHDTVTITEPDSLKLTTDSTPATQGNSDGKAWVTVKGGTTPYNYQWENNVSSTDTAQDVAAGTYAVTVTDDNGCQIIDSVEVTEVVGLTEHNNIHTFSLYPTPSNGNFQIEISFARSTKGTLTILNTQGKRVYTTSLSTDGNWRHQVQLSKQIEGGIYFVNIQTQHATLQRKIFIY